MDEEKSEFTWDLNNNFYFLKKCGVDYLCVFGDNEERVYFVLWSVDCIKSNLFTLGNVHILVKNLFYHQYFTGIVALPHVCV